MTPVRPGVTRDACCDGCLQRVLGVFCRHPRVRVARPLRAEEANADAESKRSGQPFMLLQLTCTSGSRLRLTSSHRPSSNGSKHHAQSTGYTTAGPGTAGAGFVASAVAESSLELSSEYFVATPMTAMVVN